MGSELIIVPIVGILIGVIVIKTLLKKPYFHNLFFKSFKKLEERKLNYILNDPEKLKQKLEESGEIIDMGEKININIVDKDGKKSLEFKRELKEPPKKSKKLVPKKIEKIGTKKKKIKKVSKQHKRKVEKSYIPEDSIKVIEPSEELERDLGGNFSEDQDIIEDPEDDESEDEEDSPGEEGIEKG